MALSAQNLWFSRSITFAIGAVAAASAAFWAFKFNGVANTKPSVSVDAQQPVVADVVSVARALGAVDPGAASANATSQASSRFSLIGVLAKPKSSGAALIAVDGKPAKPYSIGETVASEWVLRSVNLRSVVLAAGATDMTLELPPLPSSLIVPASTAP
jgi:general secretion pathway protein C